MRNFIALTFLLTTVAITAYSAPVTYTSLASWQAAGPAPVATIGFESLASTGQMQYPSFTLSGVTFTGSGGNLIVYPVGYIYSDLGYGPSLTSSPLPGVIAINLPSNTYGFGFVIGSGNGIAVNVTIDGGAVLLISNPTNPATNGGNPAVFWGVRSDIALSSLTIAASSTGYRAILDNFTYAGAPSGSSGSTGGTGGTGGGTVPEVSNGLLIGSGLLTLVLVRRVRR